MDVDPDLIDIGHADSVMDTDLEAAEDGVLNPVINSAAS